MALWTSLLGSREPLLPSSFYFIYFWLCCVFLAVGGLSLFAGSRGCSLIVGMQFLIAEASFSGVWAPGHEGFSSFDPGLVALQHMESSWTSDRIHVPSTVRQTANHWTTREVPGLFLNELMCVCGGRWGTHGTLEGGIKAQPATDPQKTAHLPPAPNLLILLWGVSFWCLSRRCPRLCVCTLPA